MANWKGDTRTIVIVILLIVILLIVILVLVWFCCSDRENDDDGGQYEDEAAGLTDPAGDPVGVTIDEAACPVDVLDATYPVFYSSDEFLVVTNDEDDGARLRERGVGVEEIWRLPSSGEGEPVDQLVYRVEGSIDEARALSRELELSETAEVAPHHFLSMNPIHRGHPADVPEPSPQSDQFEVSPVAPVGSVAVIDAMAGTPGPNGEHGLFIVDLLQRLGAESVELKGLPVYRGGSEALFFAEADVIAALHEIGQALVVDTEAFSAVNMSFGVYGCAGYDPAGLETVMNGLSEEHGQLSIIASVGNDGVEQLTFPAAFDTVIAVGSTTADGSRRSCFSNYGDWVDHWAPGEEVVASLAPGGSDHTWSGTSFAAPQVAAHLLSGGQVANQQPTAVGPDPNKEYAC